MITVEPKKKTIKDYLEYPERFAQLIEGQIVKSPSASYDHQDLLRTLFRQIDAYCIQKKIGECYFADLDVYFDDHNVFQPDLLFIKKARLDIIQHNGIHGAPDLVIEMLSPSNHYHDLKLKKKVYEKYGVKEYVIIDPDDKECFRYVLENEKYIEKPKTSGKFFSEILDMEITF